MVLKLATSDQGKATRLAERKRIISDRKKGVNVAADPVPMAEPIVEGRAEDGLIPVDYLNDMISIDIPAWARIRDEDYVFVFLNDKDTGAMVGVMIDYSEDVEFPITLEAPARYFTQGRHQLNYVVESASGNSSLGTAIEIIIDREAPIPTGPASLPEEYNNTITREDLDNNNGVVPITIPGYLRMETGDSVRLTWLGYNGHPAFVNYLVEAADVTANSITIEVNDEVISSGGEGNAKLHYNITDRAGNISIRSPEAGISVILNPAPDNLLAPAVPLADDGVINDDDTREPVLARIPAYGNILPGDSITLLWRSLPLYPSVTVPNPVPSEAYVLDIPIPRAAIWQDGGVSGSREVAYKVTRGSVVATSETTTVTIDLTVPGPEDPDKNTAENEALLPLTVLGNASQQNNVLEPQDLHQGAVAMVPWYENPVVGEIIRVYWGGRSSTTFVDYSITEDDVASTDTPFEIALDASIIDATAEFAAWPVTYDLINAISANLGQTTYVNVHLVGPGGADGLSIVQFLGKNDKGWLVEGDTVNPSTSVFVDRYDNMLVGDEVTLSWIGNSKTKPDKNETEEDMPNTDIESTRYSGVVIVEQRHLRDGIIFPVPYPVYIEDIGYGSAKAEYTVVQAGISFLSESARIRVDLYTPGG